MKAWAFLCIVLRRIISAVKDSQSIMLPPIDDTITAQASARGGGYRGIVRLSGPNAVAALRPWFCAFEVTPQPRIVEGELFVWGEKLPVPCTLYFWPKGRGFTGQLSIELHTIGSQPLLDATVRSLCESGCRLAGPGEFTLRAFLSGRIDLSQAEAVLGVIEADDRKQLDVALRQLAGGVGRPLAALRERLLEMLCQLEAEFDFADEEIEFLDRNILQQELEVSLQTVRQLRKQIQQRTSAANRPRIVLIGRPNAGKSSLFNALAQLATRTSVENVSAIVSPQPGTTRDWLEAELQIGETVFTLLDTAGIETVNMQSDDDRPRQLAQVFTHDAIEQAAIVLLCLEAGEIPNESETAFLHENTGRTIVVRTKSDLQTPGEASLATSIATGEGLPRLLDAIQSRLQHENTHGDIVSATALRCRESLYHADKSLQNALRLAETLQDDLLIATEMRIVLEHIGQMTGEVHNDEILDRIFSRFCIGK